jgi:uncharacterized protein (DUF1786 family)
MNRFLMLDVGAGTLDVLYFDEKSDLHYKAVVKSPIQHIAETAANLPGNLLINGNEMGGGPLSNLLRQRAQSAEVVMSVSAAATLHHNLKKVRSWGIKVIEDGKIEEFKPSGAYHTLTTGDLELERIKAIIDGFGVPFAFDVVGICAQDHGVPPLDISHLDFRHQIFGKTLDQNPFPHALLYKADEIPPALNRLTSIAMSARKLPVDEIYVMDSGMAAVLGASMDIRTREKEKVLTLDVATSHTIGAALDGDEIAGFFEYHTRDIEVDRLEALLRDLADGKLDHKQIIAEGGHGAYLRRAFGFESAEIIIATGPKRKLLETSNLSIVYGAPFGDNMLTGTVGIFEAIRRRKGLKPIWYR